MTGSKPNLIKKTNTNTNSAAFYKIGAESGFEPLMNQIEHPQSDWTTAVLFRHI